MVSISRQGHQNNSRGTRSSRPRSHGHGGTLAPIRNEVTRSQDIGNSQRARNESGNALNPSYETVTGRRQRRVRPCWRMPRPQSGTEMYQELRETRAAQERTRSTPHQQQLDREGMLQQQGQQYYCCSEERACQQHMSSQAHLCLNSFQQERSSWPQFNPQWQDQALVPSYPPDLPVQSQHYQYPGTIVSAISWEETPVPISQPPEPERVLYGSMALSSMAANSFISNATPIGFDPELFVNSNPSLSASALQPEDVYNDEAMFPITFYTNFNDFIE